MSQDHGAQAPETPQPSPSPQDPPAAARRGRPAMGRGTLIAAALAVMVAQIANALPGALNGEYQQTFNAVGSQLTWITAAFMIPVVVFELTFGVLGDKFGHRRMVLGGAVLVVAGSLVCMVSPTVQAMWVGSALNGLGAGAIYPASLALVASVARNMQERVRGIAIWAGFLSAGSALSPLIGGMFAGAGWWRGAYAVVAVFAVGTLLVALLRAQETAPAPARRLDPWGQATFALGLILVLFGLVQGPESGWTATPVAAALVAGVVLLAVFVAIERRAESPLLELNLFRNRQFTVSSIVAVVGMFAFLGACFSTSMWLGPVQHQNPMFLGLLFLLLQGPAFVLIPVISRLQHRLPASWLMAAGFTAMAIGAAIASQFDVTDRGVAKFIVPSLLVGLGFAFTLSPMTAIAVNSVPRHLTGMASATTNLLRDLGFALGPVLVGAVALSAAAGRLVPSLQGSGLPADQLGPALGIAEAGGPIALNSLPEGAPGSAAQQFALEALGSGFSQAFIVVAVAALAAALLSWFGLRGAKDPGHEPDAEVEALSAAQ